MPDLSVMRELLVDEIIGSTGAEYGRCFALLKEDAPESKLKTVRIFDVSPNSVLINLDKFEQPKTLLKGGRGQRQRCDYVLLSIWQGTPIMLFVEMKSGTAQDSEIQRQFKGAECIMDFCNSVLKRFHDQDDFLGRFLKRFIVFYKPRLAKQRTRPVRPSQKNDTPERAFKYPDPHNPTLKSLVWL
ncbi:MAG: hypothetical protein P4L55_12915 [Syntrophobacteraceae bacterium]|nr:hypothetical protein [Syntrophobacteraceae bacterium]